MFLKSLTLKGFKSFADPSTLQMEPGVTVVVGPNGSGKSNVVDAVAWVLGAQGPRTVRSSKMEDVIFAGSADRPPLGRAEVSLTIDNRAGHLPGGLAEITITRTLFRSGDSEYAINGQACRLLDVQELLSDSGVGRQQHVIVSQGQLDQILNARPEDRRAVIEEAAGILKHRRRRERAERRLAATEENLERLGDLLREVRRQMRPLERQATAARSHASLAEELRGLRLYLIGRELATLDDRRRAATSERARLAEEEATLRSSLDDLDAAADTAAAELSARREDGLVVALTRVHGLGERCRGLGGVLAERRRSLVQALDAAADADVVSSLEADAARLSAELEATARDATELEPAMQAVAVAEGELARERAAHEAAAGDQTALRSAEEAFAAARGEREPLRRALERDRGDLETLRERVTALDRRRAAVEAEAADTAVRLTESEAEVAAAANRADTARVAATAAVEAWERADGLRRQADETRHRLDARAEALARTAAEARGSAGAGLLAGVPGVTGSLVELVEIDDGWQGAFEAAVGAALAAVVVQDADTARAALGRLHESDVVGTVLALRPSVPVPAAEDRGLRQDAESVRRHVRSRTPGMDDLLDRLLSGAVAVSGGWRDAVDYALERPDLVVVTSSGDRFSTAGWIVGAGSAPATAAATEQARREAEAAAAAAEHAESVLTAARTAADTARIDAAAAGRDAERAVDRRQALEDEGARLRSELDAVRIEGEEAVRRHGALAGRVERDTDRLGELEGRLPELERTAAAAAAALRAAEETRQRQEDRRVEVESRRRDLEVRTAGLAERRAVLTNRLQDVERRLAGHVAERDQAGERRRRLEADARAVDRLGEVVGRHAARLNGLGERLQAERSRQLDEVRAGGARLEDLRRERSAVEARVTETRDVLQRLALELAESGVRQESAIEALRRELGCEPETAMSAPSPVLPDGVDAESRAAAVESELASLGPINPLALEELGTLEERHRFLEEQVEDVRRARRELHQVIRAVDDEIMRVFAEAFADVNEHFQVLVATLFPGGTGRLVLADPTDLLDTGVEVEARPAGKNVRKLSLLSGGERSLVALAFLFAVFRSRPSPFYLMDEVEAALDDVNLHRFLDLLHEFRDEAQLIIVSHQKRTMEAADALYGVTMTPGGSSKVVSQKVRRQPDDESAAAATN
ncbi:MAG TPA: chromosome segregation protein SMC [Acidimicrobiales bacterium]|nr:chromosome segregation protein SMC [Acidimicrobiales bacterium]